MGRKVEGGYYSVIPSVVLFHEELSANAKLLYAVLTNLCDGEGYCWATNEYLASLFGLSERTVSRWISQLEKLGFIRLEMVTNAKGSERRIYAGLFEVRKGGVDKNVYTGVDKNGERGIDKNVYTPQGYFNKNNITVNIPPIAPQGGAAPSSRAARKRELKEQPDWKPERFLGFWQYYPRHEDKQGAIRAWDNLQPSDELIDRLGIALRRLKASGPWQEGIGIPYAATWLRNGRWEDADGLREPPAPVGGWADDEEVI